ncbi:Asp-tRNA(Asn)/Glu-tRNA(Gln) amidotransferase subunit GatC [Xylocopilactobacillus apis]|uniref:Aspartyl/glutamyl-tRNA(Asn/Gln) amidotransferase subunit C n=1 Tax=Xylocopilactobacillus apis TaxID=2932183 RepID=A0AAU9DE73_9LACO|nr:Asp-tRNA(Asn)/Glu-tRNA(Gln) amidotransferase subunit GatC [Xylocopilactobacillus apis]BDR56446.1 aspartyl/glutamyl-tRNA(Asn/Gln) amidotransferase subunit C [Xylocopilactobacillus apis]
MISKEEVKKIAVLAKLKYNDEELNNFSDQFQDIIKFFDTLDKVDTNGVDPTYQSGDLENVFRSDIAKKSNEREALLKNAPTSKDGLIEVPSIIEE